MHKREFNGVCSEIKPRRPAITGWAVSVVVATALAVLAGCSSGGSDETEAKTGVFIDSAVEGLFYSTASQSGTTDADGTFTYLAGEVVSFYIGDILIGSAEGQDVLTPLEFVPDAVDASHPEVTNILRFLQSLDEDGDPDNGITISELTITQAQSQSLDFTLTEDDFETAANALLGLLTGGEVIELIDVAAALEHFNGSGSGGSGGGSGGSSGGGSGSPDLALSGVDTALFGDAFTADPAQTAVVLDMSDTGSIAWRQTQPDTSLLEVGLVMFNGDIYAVLLTWTNNSGSGPASASYAISCPANPFPTFTVGDCSQMSFDGTAREVGFDVSIAHTGLDGATAAIGAAGLLEY